MMFAIFLAAVFTLLALASVMALADSGLRWWSAFGPLRCELAGDMLVANRIAQRRTKGSRGPGALAGIAPRKMRHVAITRAAA